MRSLDDYLDEVKPKKSKKQTVYEQRRKKRKSFEEKHHPSYQYPVVDTDGIFSIDGTKYKVDYPQYKGKQLKDDVIYDMDHVIVANDHGQLFFFDQNFDPIEPIQI